MFKRRENIDILTRGIIKISCQLEYAVNNVWRIIPSVTVFASPFVSCYKTCHSLLIIPLTRPCLLWGIARAVANDATANGGTVCEWIF